MNAAGSVTSLESFVDGAISTTIGNAGFSRRRLRFLSESPLLTALITFRSHRYPPPWLGFILEWDIIPQASVAYFRQLGGKHAQVGWGLFAARVMAPAEFTLYEEYEDSVWAPKVPDSVVAAQESLVGYFAKLLPWMSAAMDPDFLLEHFDYGRAIASGLVAGTPSTWPARYVAVHIDDAPVEVLTPMLEQIDLGRFDIDWIKFWRRRLAARTAADGPAAPA